MNAQSPVPLHRLVLPNGLVVLYRRSPEVPLAAATLLLRTGSWQEESRQSGLASFTMELLLQGTRRRSPRELARQIEFMGASLGSQCAEDYSDMGVVAPSAQFHRALEVLSDVLQNPSFPLEEIAKERAHTLASLRSRPDVLFNVAYDRFNHELFGDHAYGRLLDGTPETIRRFTRRDVQRWHADHVHPRGSVLSIVSPLPLREIEKWIEKYFAIWKNPPVSLTRPFDTAEPMKTPRRIHLHARFEQAYLMTGLRAPSISQPGYRALKILNTVLGGGMSSRLFLKLREEMGLAYEVASFFPTHLQPSQWVIYLGLPQEKLATAEKRLNEMLRTVAQKGITPAELKQARLMIKGAYLMEHQTRRRQAWYAAWWEFLGRKPGYDQKYLREVDAITLADVRRVAQEMMAQPRVTVVVTAGRGTSNLKPNT